MIDAILLAQAMTGSTEGEAALAQLERSFWAGFGPDGLHDTPDNLWSFRHANMHYQRSVLNALLALTLARKSDRAAAQARALNEIAWRGDAVASIAPAGARAPLYRPGRARTGGELRERGAPDLEFHL